MSDEAAEHAGHEKPATVSSTLQAILHRLAGDMETIGVPLPLPDVVVRVHEHPTAAHPTYEDQFFRRVRSSDSVVRYYEHTPSTADSRGARPTPRLCSACRHPSASYFVRTVPLHAPLTVDTRALCAGCYGGSGN
jgi:hypothetical protein